MARIDTGADAENRRAMAEDELRRIREELKPQLVLTNTSLTFASENVMYSFSSERVVFQLVVATADPKAEWRQAVGTLGWSSMSPHYEPILQAIQENIQRLGQPDHNATHTTG